MEFELLVEFHLTNERAKSPFLLSLATTVFVRFDRFHHLQSLIPFQSFISFSSIFTECVSQKNKAKASRLHYTCGKLLWQILQKLLRDIMPVLINTLIAPLVSASFERRQSREKFVSLKKNTKEDIVAELEEAENEADRMDWVHKTTGAITSLFNFQFLQQPHYRKLRLENKNSATGSSLTSQQEGSNKSLMDYAFSKEAGSVSQILRRIPCNDKCAECSAPRVHHNFGVHISKVRSITLDARVWEPTILELLNNLGITYCNSIWEELLLLGDESYLQSR